MDPWELTLLAGAAGGVAAGLALSLWALYTRFLVMTPPSRALVIFGRSSRKREEKDLLGRSSRVGAARFVVGGGAFVFPWTHSCAMLSLATLDVDVPLRATVLSTGEAPARVDVRLGAQVKISSDPEGLRAAAESLLGKNEAELRALVRSVIEGHVHAALARVSPYLLEAERERVAAEIQVNAATDLVAMGLVIQSLALKEIIHVPAGGAPLLEPLVVAAPGGDLARGLFALEGHLRKVERRLEELDRRARTPEILPLTDLPSPAPRVADLR